MEIEGIIHSIGAVQTYGTAEKPFKTMAIIVETQEQYPQFIKVQFSQQKIDLARDLKIGQPIKVSFNLRGKIYTNKNGVEDCITNLDGWKVETYSAGAAQQPQVPQQRTDAQVSHGDDDLPF
jgi:hypothetical protein